MQSSLEEAKENRPGGEAGVRNLHALSAEGAAHESFLHAITWQLFHTFSVTSGNIDKKKDILDADIC
jgi:hypothetical protein